MPTAWRRYRIPDVRLRVCNTEMAVLKRRGEVWLATAAYSNYQPQIVLLRPDGAFRTVPFPGEGGGLVMLADEEGRLVCGGRDLLRFDPDGQRFEVLAREIVDGDVMWGACVTRRLIVAGSSTPKGTLAVYDRAAGRVVKRVSPVHPRAFYTYRGLEAPDGRVLMMSSLPTAVLTLIDQDALEMEQVTPPALAEFKGVQGGQFVAPDVFYCQAGARAFLLAYPGFDLIAEIPAPDGVTGFGNKTVLAGGRVIAWGGGTGRPYALDVAARRWEALVDEPVDAEGPVEDRHSCAFAVLDDGTLCGVMSTSEFWRVEPDSRQAISTPLDLIGPVYGAPLRIVRDGAIQKAFGSAHCAQRFWEVDLVTGAGVDLGSCGPGGGQVNDMIWDADRKRLLMAHYTSCTLVACDPARGGRFPENPSVFASVKCGQMRPLQVLREGVAAWMVTSPHYGTLGGALSRIDLATGAVETFTDLAPAETPVRMLLDREGQRLYLSTTIEADCQSAAPLSSSAHLMVFDTAARRLVRSFAPIAGAASLHLLAFAPEGWILVLEGSPLFDPRALWRWDPETDAVARIGAAPPRLREVLPAPDGRTLWATGAEGVGRLVLGDPARVEPVVADADAVAGGQDGVAKHLQWDGRSLWFILGREIVNVDVDQRG